MIPSLPKSNRYFILCFLAAISGVFLYDIYADVSRNGIYFLAPFLLFGSISMLLFFFESENLDNEKSIENDSRIINTRSYFISNILTFKNISIYWVLSLVSFIESILFVTVFGYALNTIFKFLYNDSVTIFLESTWFIASIISLWLILLYIKVSSKNDRNFKWFNAIVYILFFLSFFILSLGIFYNPKFVFELVTSSEKDNLLKNTFYLKPHTILDASVWLKSAGKTFLIFMFLNLLYNHLPKSDDSIENKTTEQNPIRANMLLSSILIGIILSGGFFTHIIYKNWYKYMTYNESYQRLDYLLVFLIINLSSIILFMNFSKNLFYVNVEKCKRISTEIPSLVGSISSDFRFYILLVLFGSLFGSFFYFVDYEHYLPWIGAVFLFFLLGRYIVLLKTFFSVNLKTKLFKQKENSQLTQAKVFVLKFVFPALFIPVFFSLIPSIYADFLLNKSLNERIEYLQDAGRISSNHHEREPLIFRDHYSVINAIDSSELKLNEIDSLNYFQKDSIRFYLENRILKKDEMFRFRELKQKHDIVRIKNVSRISLLLFFGFLIYSYFTWSKSVKD